jgi:hypothetical protein
MRNKYWSSTKFANWIRGSNKPYALSWQGWAKWRKEQQANHPVRYWIAEDGLDYLQKFVTWPLDKLHDFKYYINNRFVTRTHQLTAHARDIQPGTWCDVGNRFLPCLFNELVDFVEIEQSWHHCAWSDESKTKFNIPWWAHGWFRWRTWRSAEAGLEYLKWASELTINENAGVSPGGANYGEPTSQAIHAMEILALYKWWTETRPARPDPHESSGLNTIYAQRRANRNDDDDYDFMGENDSEYQKLESKKAMNICHHIEEEYEKEDTEMMIRLIRIRRGLWT